MSKLFVYTCGHMTPFSAEDARQWRDWVTTQLEPYGVEVVSPMRGLEYLEGKRVVGILPEEGTGLSKEQAREAAIARDLWDIQRADIVLANLTSEAHTTGSIAEMAWAYLLRKTIVLVAPEGKYYAEHPFTRGMASLRFDTLEQGVKWIIDNFKPYFSNRHGTANGYKVPQDTKIPTRAAGW